jgi:hypothetical protein
LALQVLICVLLGVFPGDLPEQETKPTVSTAGASADDKGAPAPAKEAAIDSISQQVDAKIHQLEEAEDLRRKQRKLQKSAVRRSLYMTTAVAL